ncbi:hypothetical protein [Nocardia sp. NPDC002869]|uniref:hypothetical protein n=1 Tax=Nocardia sp. NPDC002869 TaxID=3161032 RepID=UPI00398D088E
MMFGDDIDRMMAQLRRDTLLDCDTKYDRFIPVDEAAERMNTTPDKVVEGVRAGALRAIREFDVLMVEPAITNWRG